MRTRITESDIQKAVRQTISEMNRMVLYEYSKKDINRKRKAVMRALQTNGVKKSDLAYALWKPKNQSDKDRQRSEFSKKANGTPDADGAVRQFTDDEINSLYQMVRKIGN